MTNVRCCIPDTHSHKVSAQVYLLPKVKILRTFENVLPLTVSIEHHTQHLAIAKEVGDRAG